MEHNLAFGTVGGSGLGVMIMSLISMVVFFTCLMVPAGREEDYQG